MVRYFISAVRLVFPLRGLHLRTGRGAPKNMFTWENNGFLPAHENYIFKREILPANAVATLDQIHKQTNLFKSDPRMLDIAIMPF
jgi:hypothetical protein